MLTVISAGKLATLGAAAAAAPAVRDVVPDITLAQLDIIAAASGGAMHAVTGGAVDPFVFRFSIFVLAIFVGYYVVWSVTPALHTPLMSVTNAISSVIVVGALLAIGVPLAADGAGPLWARVLGFVALGLASVNIFGGFLVTQRMLGMYQKKKK
jgi:NAD(P) transhydrogenase subunit alpha